jgi:hypothetical protein
MFVAAVVASGLLFVACAEDAPTANPGGLPSSRASTVQGAVLSPTAHSTIVVSTDIHACINNSSGTIKIISAGTPCAGNELLLTWSTGLGDGGTGYEIVFGSNTNLLPHGSSANESVQCPTGKRPVNGGSWSGPGLIVSVSHPDFTTPSAWQVTITNNDVQGEDWGPGRAKLYAICLNA